MSSDDDDYFLDDPHDSRPGAAKQGGGGGKKKAGGGDLRAKPNPKQQQQQQSKASSGGRTPPPQQRSPQLKGQSAAAAPAKHMAHTSDKLLARLQWDDVLDVREFDIIYEDRFAGRMSIPAARFRGTEGQTAEGDAIPWHRVYQFVYKGRVVWDRDARMDIVDQLVEELRAAKEAEDAKEEQAAVTGLTSLRHLGGERVRIVLPPNAKAHKEAAEAAAEAAANPTPSKKQAQKDMLLPLAKGASLKVVTYNILHDLFDADAVYTDARLPLIAKELEAQQADVIFLQEVTLQRFRDLLNISSHLRNLFYWTFLPSEVNTVQVTGSRFPLMEGFAESVSRKKRRMCALMENPWAPPHSKEAKALPVLLVNCHFLSDHGGGAVNRRLAEVRDINRNLSGFPRVVLAGDFNYGDQNQESSVVYEALWDAWIEDYKTLNSIPQLPAQDEYIVAGQMPKKLSAIGGFTFDCTSNPLANISCEHHRYPRRLDRIMYRAFKVARGTCKIFAKDPYPISAVPKEAIDAANAANALLPSDGKIYPSDHYGVAVELLMDDEAFVRAAPTASSVSSAIGAAAAEDGRGDGAAPAAAAAFAGGVSPISKSLSGGFDPVVAALAKAGSFTKHFRTALVFLPPKQLFDRINRFRDNNRDKAFPRWMPHTTILFPFVHPDQFPAAINLIEAALQTGAWVTQPAFRVRVAKPGEFRRGNAPKAVVFLQPECIDAKSRDNLGVAPMKRVFEPLQRLFPSCGRDAGDDNNEGSGAAAAAAAAAASSSPASSSSAEDGAAAAARNYSPHFTVGQTNNMKDHAEFVARINAEWEPVEFDITQFHLIAHLDGKDGFEVIRSFDLPSSSAAQSSPSAAAGAAADKDTGAASAAAADGPEAMATILEPPQWGSRLLKPYVPPDPLEKWMAKVSISKYARDAPTHISMLGGCYHIESSLIDEYLMRWKESHQLRETVPAYVEEVRGAPFRLYVDLDFDLSTEEPVKARYALDLIREVCILLAKIFGPSADSTALVFECHGSASKKFADGTVPMKGPAANDHDDDDPKDVRSYKSGYRIYFQRMFVDCATTYDKILNAMSNYLRRKQWPMPENVVRGVTWDDVIDKRAVTWDRGRLLGTIKRRKNLKRIYELAAAVDVRGTNEVLTKEFQRSLLRQLYGSTLRLWNKLPAAVDGMSVLMDNEFNIQRALQWNPEAEAAAATAHQQSK